MADSDARKVLGPGGPAAAPPLFPAAASLAPYALIVESMTEGVSLASEDGIIVYTNPAEERMFGYGRGELIGRHVSIQNAYPEPENARRVAAAIAALRSDGRWEGEWHNLRKDGSSFFTASRINAVEIDGRLHWLCVQRDITAERAAEAAHRETEERLQLAVEGTGVGIYDMDLASGDGFWSESTFSLLGYPPDQDGHATLAMWQDRLHPDDAEAVLAQHGRAAASGDLRIEFRILRADNGELRWLSSRGRILPGPAGLRSIGTVLDITEQRRIEAAARAGEARLRVAMEAGRLGSWWFDAQRRVGGWSEYSAGMLGLSSAGRDVSYEEWREIVHPADRAEAEAAFGAALAGRTPGYDVEYRVIHSNGAIRRLRAVGAIERAACGAPSYVVGTFRDVTEERAASEALAETAARLDLAVTSHGIGIFDWYIQTGRVVWTSQEESLFDFSPGSFGGTIEQWVERLLPADADAMRDKAATAFAEHRDRLDFSFRIQRGESAIRWIEGSSRILYADDGTPLRMVGTNMDVTERRQAEQHQRLLVNELNHRVKNTLAIVQGIAHQSFRGSTVPQEVRVAFEGRLRALSGAHDLLTRESWEAAAIAKVIGDAAAPIAGERVAMAGPDVRLPPRTAVSLALAVHELCTNAAKYGALLSAEGRIAVSWSVTGDRLSLRWQESGGPPVASPERRGFGTRMIERALAAEFGGAVRIEFAPGGLICTLEATLPG